MVAMVIIIILIFLIFKEVGQLDVENRNVFGLLTILAYLVAIITIVFVKLVEYFQNIVHFNDPCQTKITRYIKMSRRTPAIMDE